MNTVNACACWNIFLVLTLYNTYLLLSVLGETYWIKFSFQNFSNNSCSLEFPDITAKGLTIPFDVNTKFTAVKLLEMSF